MLRALVNRLVGSDRDRPASPHGRKTQIGRLAWACVEATLFRYSFHTSDRHRARLLRLFGAKVGRGCIIRRTVGVYYPWNLEIGDRCVLGDRATIYNLAPIQLGDGAVVSQEAYLCAGTHDYTRRSFPLVVRPIHLGSQSWVCARAFVGPGTNVGEGAVVAASAVVVRDVPNWTIVGGNPARTIKSRTRPEED